MKAMPIPRLLASALLVAPLALAACGDDGTGPQDRAAGTYRLAQVNGSDLPTVVYSYQVDQTTYEFEVIEGRLELGTGAYTGHLIVETLQNGAWAKTDTISDAGSYKASGETITFTPTEGRGSFSGTLDGSTLTTTENPGFATFTGVYRR